MAYAVSGELGVNLATVYDEVSTSTPEIPGLPFALGQEVRAGGNQSYVFVKSSGAITQYAALAIDENFIARQVTTTLAGEANSFGVAQVAAATDQYFFAATKGHELTVLCRDAVTANAQLYTSTSAGKLTSVASTGSPWLINGARAVTAATSAGGAVRTCEIIANYPSFSPHPEPVA